MSTHYGVVVPTWILDDLLPLLTPEEWKVHSYLIRRSWGLRYRSARISIQQFATGTSAKGRVYDRGTGLGDKTCRKAVRDLKRLGVIIEEKPPLRLAKAGPLLRPGWIPEVQWGVLKKRQVERLAAVRARFEGPPGLTLEEVFEIEAASMPAGDGIFADVSQQMYWELFHIEEEGEIVVANVTIEEGAPLDAVKGVWSEAPLKAGEVRTGAGKPFEHHAEQAAREAAQKENAVPGVRYPKFDRRREPEYLTRARALGVDAKDAVAIAQTLLELTGRSELADQDTDFGSLALSEAHQAAVTMIGLGYKTAESVRGLAAPWGQSWFSKKALEKGEPIPVPSTRQLVDLAAKTISEQKKTAETAAKTEAREKKKAARKAATLPADFKPRKPTMSDMYQE